MGWIATSVGGVRVGKSAATGNNDPKSASQIVLEWIARWVPLVFISGLVAVLATAIHAILLYAFGTFPALKSYENSYVTLYWYGFETIAKSDWAVVACMASVAVLAFLYSLRLDINIFSLSNFYRNRLVRCYLGATRDDRKAQAFTGFDDEDDLPLSDLVYDC